MMVGRYLVGKQSKVKNSGISKTTKKCSRNHIKLNIKLIYKSKQY